MPQGVIFVSVNYRMIPEAEPLAQAEDVARALAKVQEMAPGWGGDPRTSSSWAIPRARIWWR